MVNRRRRILNFSMGAGFSNNVVGARVDRHRLSNRHVGHEVAGIPEVEIDAIGVTSTLKISITSIVSGVPKVSKYSG